MTVMEDLVLIERICEPCKHFNDPDDTFCQHCGKVDRERRKLTHRQLCELGARFLLTQRHPTNYPWRILIETGYRKENPDVFAYTKYYSVLIECKASRSDFLADKRKPFRQDPLQGVGRRRYYLVNEGVAKQEEMPEGWQLLIARDKDTILLPVDYQPPAYGAEDKYVFDIRNASAETELMWSWEYRKERKCLPDFPCDPVTAIAYMNWVGSLT